MATVYRASGAKFKFRLHPIYITFQTIESRTPSSYTRRDIRRTRSDAVIPLKGHSRFLEYSICVRKSRFAMLLLPDYTRRIISRAGNKKFTRKRRIYYHQHTFKRRNGLPSKQRAGGRRVWSITRCSLVLCTSGNWCSIVPRIIYTRNMESILHLENLQISTFSLFSSCFLRPILFKSRIFIKDENNSTKRTNK